MLQNYIKRYAEHFNLLCGTHKCYDEYGNLLVTLMDEGKYIYYKSKDGSWKKGKQGDLILCIVNQIPLHQ